MSQLFVPLRDGRAIPAVGLGVWQLDDTEAVVSTAIETGYRLIDTAAIYGNEAEVGRAVRASGLARSELTVTTKLFNTEHGADRAGAAVQRSLDALGLDHIDLYLIHWPLPGIDRYVETWEALLPLRDSGVIRALGVSNFLPSHIERLIRETGEAPVLNQVERHPYLSQAELLAYHASVGIATQVWSPLANGRVLRDPVLQGIADARGRTVAEVVLRWQLQAGVAVIPKASTRERLAQNLAVAELELNDAELAAIAALEDGTRTGDDPATYNGKGMPPSATPY